MKKRLRYILHISLLCIVVLLSSCVNTLEFVAPQGEGRVMSHEGAVADAKAYFDTHFGQNTRSNDQTPSHEAPYVVGDLVYRGEGVDVLLHELFHTYQYRMINSEETFEASNAKLEIEAQIARTLFAVRLKDKGEQSYYNALNETRLGFAFVDLTNHYISHTAESQSSVNSKYTKLYDYIGTYLSDHLGYNYVSGDVSYDYELLTAISENCDDYGKD